jgi:hypothetical protein
LISTKHYDQQIRELGVPTGLRQKLAGAWPRHRDLACGPNRERRRPQGGFRVGYKNLGRDGERSVYDPTTLTILINLDHPLVAAALGEGNVEDTTFRRLSYEIAFSEYAMGLGYEVSQQDPNMAPDDLLYEVRSTLNRISTAAVALYH